MKTEPQRLLEWEGCVNARDLGGYPTRDGGETRWGAIIRSDNLAQLTESGQRALLDHGIKTILDLRMPNELKEHPNPFAGSGDLGVTYTNVSFIDPAAQAPPEDFTTLADDYSDMLQRFAPKVAAIVTSIVRAPQGGVLIHCHAGKDRTGLISALLLELVGVPREIIVEDYALTAQLLRASDEAWLENGPGGRADRERQFELYRARPEVMLAVLDRVDHTYGGVDAYLRQAGVSEEDLMRVRERLTGPSPPTPLP